MGNGDLIYLWGRKKNVPETSSKTNWEGKRAFREQAQHGPRDSTQKQTIAFVRTNDAGTSISKVSIRRLEILLLSACGLGRSLGVCVYMCVCVCMCEKGLFSGGNPDSSWVVRARAKCSSMPLSKLTLEFWDQDLHLKSLFPSVS